MSRLLKKRFNPLDNGILKIINRKETTKKDQIMREKVNKIIQDFERNCILKMIKISINKPRKLSNQAKAVQQFIKRFEECNRKTIKKVRFGKNVIFHFNP